MVQHIICSLSTIVTAPTGFIGGGGGGVVHGEIPSANHNKQAL